MGTENRDSQTRIAVIAIIVDDMDSVGALNGALHEYSEYVIGRMGLPYREKQTHIISVAVDAPEPVINALSGKLGMIDGVTSRTVYGKI
ncbi:MAG: iron-only hydrogenase system regulator [Clostridiales Family XIII bacterium]|jgi:putative iron-only hydrogenase system regulator|nr:iron-only hydrogenase system regulator [Clostridiales Family XIII bacterium]